MKEEGPTPGHSLERASKANRELNCAWNLGLPEGSRRDREGWGVHGGEEWQPRGSGLRAPSLPVCGLCYVVLSGGGLTAGRFLFLFP